MFCCFVLFCRLKSNILGKSVYKYASGGTLASTLADLGLKQSTVTKSETQGDRSKCTNVGTVDHLLDEEGVYHSSDASAKKRGITTSFSSMEVSAASSLANEEFNVHDMRVPVTNLSKDAPQLDKGMLT